MNQVFATEEGRSLIFAGCGIGLLFALAVLCLTIVAFPCCSIRTAARQRQS